LIEQLNIYLDRRFEMLRKLLIVLGVFLLGGGLIVALMGRLPARVIASDELDCPPGYVHLVELEPLQDSETSSNPVDLGCEPISEDVQMVTLKPIHPGDEGWEVRPYEPTEKSEIVFGPSEETSYRCVFYLHPITPGEQASKVSEPVCSDGLIDTINGISLESTYLIAKFYDNINYTNLLVEYYGASPCSSTVSYGVAALPGNLGYKFSSVQSFSNCNLIEIYEFSNFNGPFYACGPECSDFYALNNHVSSWETSQ
jgi:hypothetical protein